jgi:CubicO group peptidase (beta-lactamase class C family)
MCLTYVSTSARSMNLLFTRACGAGRFAPTYVQMRTFIAAGLLAFMACLCSAYAAESVPLQSRIDNMFTPWTKANVPGCAVGVIEKGQWLARGGYGSAGIERGVRITPDTVFYAASVSKQFTAAAMLRLIDHGKATLDDDIRRHIPEFPKHSPPITIRDLVHHTSGFPDYVELLARAGTLHNAHSSEEILATLAAQQPAFPAGLMFSYSNSNYFLIAEIVRRASGSSLRNFARQTLFAPLGMADTRFYDDPTEIVPRYASGYVEEGRGQYRVVKTSYAQVGAGGLLTTINDLGKWVRIFDDSSAIAESPRLGQRLLERGALSDGSAVDYAFGLVNEKEHGLDVASHLGQFPGFTASFSWIPSKRMALFALCNWSQAPIQTIRGNVLNEALR